MDPALEEDQEQLMFDDEQTPRGTPRSASRALQSIGEKD